MSSHRVCCLVGACCPPALQEKYLADMIEAAGSPAAAAAAILAHADLVPKGVGVALVEKYRPMFVPVNEAAKGTPDEGA